jgi:hypothetical protein
MNKYGPNSPQVELFIERLKVLTDEEARGIAARSAARSAARDAARSAAWDAAAWSAAWIAGRDVAAWIAPWEAAWIVTAIVAMDLITEEQFQILTEPFAEILVELGIAWEGK